MRDIYFFPERFISCLRVFWVFFHLPECKELLNTTFCLLGKEFIW